MTTEQATPTTPADQIAALEEALACEAPAAVLATYGREIEALVRSGMAASGLPEGALAPDFTLSNVDGRQFTLPALLAEGRSSSPSTEVRGAPSATCSCGPTRRSCLRSGSWAPPYLSQGRIAHLCLRC
jgi:hypothetical protein